jgi:hypothetical protein
MGLISNAFCERTAGIPRTIPFKGGQIAMAINHDITNELRKSCAMELETVQNYLANSIDLDGVRAEEIKKALFRD